ncbi:MAG: hypothetical protein H7Y07_16605 [Pyrinomonadaceae bacterium]|nr:hypothetical protein [Sphingobacteriaceae bacterium]
MIRITYILFFGALIFSSCDGLKNNKEKAQAMQNQLIVTAAGDTLENGFWTYDSGINNVSQSGNYEDGYKIGKWIYKMNGDSVNTTWRVISDKGVKFNIPDYFKPINNVESPVLFQADIEDNDDNTYLVLLRYNLTELNSSVYDYLYQYNDSWKNNTKAVLKSKEFKKFYFKGIEIFQAKVQTEREIKYEAISYVFVVKDFLYDLTYKNAIGKSNAINLEIFNDILYSMQCENVDLFSYNSRKYLKEENVEFKSNSIN